MSDQDEKRTRLLAESFADWDGGEPANFARQAAAQVRRRRATRRALVGGAAVAVLAIWGVLAPRQPAVAPSPVDRAVVATARGYEIMSDDELLARLRDRPVLVVKGENGARQFVLLEPPETHPPRSE